MKFIIFVIDDLTGSATADEIVAIDAFNDNLKANNQWIFAGGLSAISSATVLIIEKMPILILEHLYLMKRRISPDFG